MPSAIHDAIASLQRVSELFNERRQRLAREAGLTEAQWQVLEGVAGEGFMHSMFARRRAISAAGVSRSLRQLQEAGLLKASIAEGDGRQRDYRLTARGKRTLEKLTQNRAKAIEDIWERFEPAELAAFTRFSDELSDRLEAYLDRKPVK